MKMRDNRSPAYFSFLLTPLKERLGTKKGLVKTLKSENVKFGENPQTWIANCINSPKDV